MSAGLEVSAVARHQLPAGGISGTQPLTQQRTTGIHETQQQSHHQFRQAYSSDGEDGRGRGRAREGTAQGSSTNDGLNGADAVETSETSGMTSRKRRRSRKGLDKKHDCKFPGCTKSYSRQEHLYRHQLNHQPKTIYQCDYPECDRSFVRQDLCTRHKERHSNRGSHLQRRDSFLRNPSSAAIGKVPHDRRSSITTMGSLSPVSSSHSPLVKDELATVRTVEENDQQKIRRTSGDSAPGERHVAHVARGNHAREPMPRDCSGSSSFVPLRNGSVVEPIIIPNQSASRFDGLPVQTPTTNMQGLSLRSPYPNSQSAGSVVAASGSAQFSPRSTGTELNSGADSTIPLPGRSQYAGASNSYHFTPSSQPALPNTHIFGVHDSVGTTQGEAPDYTTQGPASTSTDALTMMPTTGAMDYESSLLTQFTMPVFGGENAYNRSPPGGGGIPPEFLDFLFVPEGGQGSSQSNGDGVNPFFESGLDAQNIWGIGGSGLGNTFFNGQPLSTHPMNISTIAPPSPPRESLLSEDKRAALLCLVDHDTSAFTTMQRDDDRHPLSLNMMQHYIQLYWMHFHPQLPILHRPTFSVEKTPDILLLCIMAIGAASIDYKQDPTLAKEAGGFAKAIAGSIRWRIFDHGDFRPPAKIWVFQALLLLETYEKMYADRRLHERAHIHHATTLTLMRRGSSLTGSSGSFDSPRSGRDIKAGSEASTTPGVGSSSDDEHWNCWILQEATKRVAFAAFILDSTHAAMFGHSANLAAHEMRLQLPCDETLWVAQSWSEVTSIRRSLAQNGIRPLLFLEGLKKTLMGHKVPTNSFGRTILMAGLLSVTWHLHQRDLQASSIGLDVRETRIENWRQALTRSFDNWRKDFDISMEILIQNHRAYDPMPYLATEDVKHENLFESRTVLHHLAHLSMHADIVDLQVYAGSRKLLGRSITGKDYEMARKKMKAWAVKAQARDAAYYAYRFLSQVLLEQEQVNGSPNGRPAYSARDDHLLNRPWVIYYASLVVWAYGHALDGPVHNAAATDDLSDLQVHDLMRSFLGAASKYMNPADIANFRGKNETVGLLLTVVRMFKVCRWELLVEASELLRNCARLAAGEITN